MIRLAVCWAFYNAVDMIDVDNQRHIPEKSMPKCMRSGIEAELTYSKEFYTSQVLKISLEQFGAFGPPLMRPFSTN